MQKRNIGLLGFVLFESCLLFSQVTDHSPPVFYFGGKQFYVGMSKREAVAALSVCCKLLPSVESEVEKRPSAAGKMPGHFILQEEPPNGVLGSIYFSDGKVARISRGVAEDVDTFNEDLVAFMRALKRSLPEGDTTAVVSLRHERMSNAESDVVTLVFPNGRGIELHFGRWTRLVKILAGETSLRSMKR